MEFQVCKSAVEMALYGKKRHLRMISKIKTKISPTNLSRLELKDERQIEI